MGFSESDSSNCRRHPNHKQLPGICSSCLREKLSKLNSTPSFNSRRKNMVFTHSSSSSSTPPYSTTSTAATGTRKSRGNHCRNGSDAYVSVGMVLNNGLKKSRSVSCAPLTRNKGANNNNVIDITGKFIDEVDQQDNGKKKGGLLKRLINSTSKKTKGALMHSKTMKDRLSSHNSATATKIVKN